MGAGVQATREGEIRCPFVYSLTQAEQKAQLGFKFGSHVVLSGDYDLR